MIKGTFKDHIVTWVTDYIKGIHSESETNRILDDIDHRLVINPIYKCYNNIHIELHWHLHFRVFDAFQRVGALSNGLGMTQRHL